RPGLRLGRDRRSGRRGRARGGPRFAGSRRARNGRRCGFPARRRRLWRFGALSLGFWSFAPATRFLWRENGAQVRTLLLGPRLDLGGFAQLTDQPLKHLPPTIPVRHFAAANPLIHTNRSISNNSSLLA